MDSFERYYANVLLENFAKFTGKATRREYWMFVIYNALILIVLEIAALFLFKDDNGVIVSIYELVTFIPSLALSVRRMHDIGKTGWVLLWGIIPIFGGVYLLVLSCLPGVVMPMSSSSRLAAPSTFNSTASMTPSSSIHGQSSPEGLDTKNIRDKWK